MTSESKDTAVQFPIFLSKLANLVQRSLQLLTISLPQERGGGIPQKSRKI
jgi:hypothetical protein